MIVAAATAAFAAAILVLVVLALARFGRPRTPGGLAGFRDAGDVGIHVRLVTASAGVAALGEECRRLRWIALDGMPSGARTPGTLRGLADELAAVATYTRALDEAVAHASTIWQDRVLRDLEDPPIADRLPGLERDLRVLASRVRAVDDRLGPVETPVRPAP